MRLDFNEKASPDVVFDLNRLECGDHLPFSDNDFDEIHAYEVLEHFGTLGDFAGFFRTFGELWRILKPNGSLMGSTPDLASPWLWGDPGHRRVISRQSLHFLQPEAYMYLGMDFSSDYSAEVAGRYWRIVQSYVMGPTYAFELRKLV